jgi:hypothetical protein
VKELSSPKVKTRKKNYMSAEEINAYRCAYGKPLGKKDYVVMVGLPSVALGGILFFLTYRWYLLIIGFIIGAIYGRKVIMPQSAQRNYEVCAMNERNKLVKVITQSCTNPNMIPSQVLSRSLVRISGEIKEEFEILETNVALGRMDLIPVLFKQIREKYREDIVFCQFLEQLETRFMKGNPNIKAIKEMEMYHSQMLETRDKFQAAKNGHLHDLKALGGIMLFLMGALEFAFSFQKFYDAYASTFIGLITTFVYVGVLCFFFTNFITLFFDDSITELKIKKLTNGVAKRKKIERVDIADKLREISADNGSGTTRGFGVKKNNPFDEEYYTSDEVLI